MTGKHFAITLLAAAAALVFSGCVRETSPLQNRVVLAVEHHRIDISGVPGKSLPELIRAAVPASGLKGEIRQAVYIHGPSMSRERQREVASALTAAGVSKRDVKYSVGESGSESVVVQVMGPRLIEPVRGPLDDYWFSQAAVHPDFGAATNINLGLQVVKPEQLAAPASLGPPNPMATVGAVERYQKGEVRALGEQALEAGQSGEN
jgi:type IV pilus biogenesis protein CpaD/CtpE